MSQPFIYALWGIAFGFVLSAPVGPVNIICLRRTLFGRARDGFLIGLGAAAGDAFYAGLAAFGLNAIFTMIENYSVQLKLFGGAIMLIFAYRIWFSRPHLNEEPINGGLKRGMLGALVLTVTNPGVFLGFIGLYSLAGIGDLGAGSNGLDMDASALVVGVFLGASLWWLTLSLLAWKFREKINDKLLERINHFSAGLIGIFAVVTLVSALLF